ncbi:MAG: hypothetical protein IT462_07590 [Planctomycetes bacterium]|nr:hypothetical protein [Planctomycetota bacterium]
MRLTLAAALAAVVMLVAGCTDTEARLQNAKLQAEIDALKNKSGGGNDDLIKAMLLSKNDDTGGNLAELRKNIASISGDLTSGLKSLNKEVADSSSDSRKRLDSLETKLDKVKELETSLVALKSMVETLEKTAKAVDPNQVLELNKQLLQAQADLRAEQLARQAAETRAVEAEKARSDSQILLAAAQHELDELKAGKASGMPEYKKLKADYDALKAKLEQSNSDYKALEELNRRLRESNDQMRAELRKRGVETPPEVSGPSTPTPTPVTDNPGVEKAYAFTGKVVKVQSGAKPNSPSLVMVDIGTGEIPPEKSELIVLDSKNNKICRLVVQKLFHEDDNADKKVNLIGCKTLDENPVKPVATDDKVVWVKAEAGGK